MVSKNEVLVRFYSEEFKSLFNYLNDSSKERIKLLNEYLLEGHGSDEIKFLCYNGIYFQVSDHKTSLRPAHYLTTGKDLGYSRERNVNHFLEEGLGYYISNATTKGIFICGRKFLEKIPKVGEDLIFDKFRSRFHEFNIDDPNLIQIL